MNNSKTLKLKQDPEIQPPFYYLHLCFVECQSVLGETGLLVGRRMFVIYTVEPDYRVTLTYMLTICIIFHDNGVYPSVLTSPIRPLLSAVTLTER